MNSVAGLQGLPQPEDCLGDWQSAWDEMVDAHLEGGEDGEGRAVDIQRKRPDAWAIKWSRRRLVILEFTRPNDQGVDAGNLIQDMVALTLGEMTEIYSVRYAALQNVQGQ